MIDVFLLRWGALSLSLSFCLYFWFCLWFCLSISLSFCFCFWLSLFLSSSFPLLLLHWWLFSSHAIRITGWDYVCSYGRACWSAREKSATSCLKLFLRNTRDSLSLPPALSSSTQASFHGSFIEKATPSDARKFSREKYVFHNFTRTRPDPQAMPSDTRKIDPCRSFGSTIARIIRAASDSERRQFGNVLYQYS